MNARPWWPCYEGLVLPNQELGSDPQPVEEGNLDAVFPQVNLKGPSVQSSWSRRTLAEGTCPWHAMRRLGGLGSSSSAWSHSNIPYSRRLLKAGRPRGSHSLSW